MYRLLASLLILFLGASHLHSKPAQVSSCPQAVRELKQPQIRPHVPNMPPALVSAISWLAFSYSNQIYRETLRRNPANDPSFNFFDEFLISHEIQLSSSIAGSIPPAGEPVVFAANHPSGPLEAFAILAELYKHRRDVVVVAARLTNGMTEMEAIALDPREGTERQIFRALRDGKAVLIFPYGHISDRRDPETQEILDGEWKEGFIRFASRFQAPIIPTFVDLEPGRLYQAGIRVHNLGQRAMGALTGTNDTDSQNPHPSLTERICQGLECLLHKLKLLAVPFDFNSTRGQQVQVSFGASVPYEDYSQYATPQDAANALRDQTYELRLRRPN